MQTLDTLGAGFTLASYDMDIRGAGNLLGDEQSGHVREVGVERIKKCYDKRLMRQNLESQVMTTHLQKWSGHRK